MREPSPDTSGSTVRRARPVALASAFLTTTPVLAQVETYDGTRLGIIEFQTIDEDDSDTVSMVESVRTRATTLRLSA